MSLVPALTLRGGCGAAGGLQGQTGKFFFVVQTGTFALKIPATKSDTPGQPDHPEQTVRPTVARPPSQAPPAHRP